MILEFSFKNGYEYGEQPYANFEKKLSEEISSAPLIFDDKKGEMSGRISLVFSIDDESFELIKQKNDGAISNTTSQIRLSTGYTFFSFITSNFRYENEIKTNY